MAAKRTSTADEKTQAEELVLLNADRNIGAEATDNAPNTPEAQEGQVHQEEFAARDVIAGTDVPVAPDPRDEGTTRDKSADTANRLEVKEPEKAAEERVALPENAFDSEAFRAANSGARDSFAQIVRRPGYVFPDHGGGGRFVNIFDLEDVYDVAPNQVVPGGLFLFPANYLVREEDREDRLRG